MKMSIAEILDRLSIVMIKREKISKEKFEQEYNRLLNFVHKLKENNIIDNQWLETLYKLNKKEWELLEEIGKLYIKTEKYNKLRAEMKNIISVETGTGFKEIKQNHLSENVDKTKKGLKDFTNIYKKVDK